jgi:hypothetical protein
MFDKEEGTTEVSEFGAWMPQGCPLKEAESQGATERSE